MFNPRVIATAIFVATLLWWADLLVPLYDKVVKPYIVDEVLEEGRAGHKKKGLHPQHFYPNGRYTVEARGSRVASTGRASSPVAGKNAYMPGLPSKHCKNLPAGKYCAPVVNTNFEIGDTLGAGRGHKGADINMTGDEDCGELVFASQPGVVEVLKYDPVEPGTRADSPGEKAGKYLKITDDVHGSSRYMHLDEDLGFLVSEGDFVVAGQLIGRVGTTGGSSGCHLHFEQYNAQGENITNTATFVSALGEATFSRAHKPIPWRK